MATRRGNSLAFSLSLSLPLSLFLPLPPSSTCPPLSSFSKSDVEKENFKERGLKTKDLAMVIRVGMMGDTVAHVLPLIILWSALRLWHAGPRRTLGKGKEGN